VSVGPFWPFTTVSWSPGWTQDNRNDFGDRTELRGTYATEALAKAAAKRDLLDEWDREFFELYKEDYDGHRGVYDVYAEFPEGEAMGVYIQESAIQGESTEINEDSATATTEIKADSLIDG
jgi:hypothetical protein